MYPLRAAKEESSCVSVAPPPFLCSSTVSCWDISCGGCWRKKVKRASSGRISRLTLYAFTMLLSQLCCSALLICSIHYVHLQHHCIRKGGRSSYLGLTEAKHKRLINMEHVHLVESFGPVAQCTGPRSAAARGSWVLQRTQQAGGSACACSCMLASGWP